jgi:hypothetical protein
MSDVEVALLRARIRVALDTAERYGGIDGAHHKQWVISQMVRALLGSDQEYGKWLEEQKEEPEDEDWGAYEWDEGIAP